jgi:RNA polymerase sigma-70 factor (ECF subfamily)
LVTTLQSRVTEEQALAERAGAGDHSAFSLLFERYKAGIYRFCFLMLGSQSAAEDVYQEVFLNFYRACRAGRPMYNVKAYLLSAARSRCINDLNLSHRAVDLDEVSDLSYEQDVTSNDMGVHLRDALQLIQPQYREVFLLFEYEGYSYEEIASQLDISRDVVRNRLYRAKQALQKILRPLLGDDRSEDQ